MPERLRRLGHLRRAAAMHPESWRFRLIARTPTVLIDYLFEVLLITAAVISGVGQLTGIAPSNSVNQMLPGAVRTAYSLMLLVGAGTAILGLARRRYGTTVPLGMRLLSWACFAYCGAVAGVVGFGALTVVLQSLTLGLLACWRAFLLHAAYLLICSSGTPEDLGG